MSKYDEESAELCEALDALDAAHAEEVREAREDGYQEGLRDARANLVADRRETVELPKDADGVTWHLGDRIGGATRSVAVCAMELREDGWHLLSDGASYDPATNRHASDTCDTGVAARRDTPEALADELEAWCDRVDVDGDACDVPRDLAKRIRRLAKKEG